MTVRELIKKLQALPLKKQKTQQVIINKEDISFVSIEKDCFVIHTDSGEN